MVNFPVGESMDVSIALLTSLAPPRLSSPFPAPSRVFSCGRGNFGQLGSGDTKGGAVLREVGGFQNPAALTAGRTHSLVATGARFAIYMVSFNKPVIDFVETPADGALSGFGETAAGQLGSQSPYRLLPANISLPLPIDGVAGGATASFATSGACNRPVFFQKSGANFERPCCMMPDHRPVHLPH